jgi:hypothetical protein
METGTEQKVKYREVVVEEKSAAEREAEVLAKAEEQKAQREETIAATTETEQKQETTIVAAEQAELTDEVVLGYVKKKLNKEVNSFEDLFKGQETEVLPEDVALFAKYKKETGRGIEDFLKVQRNVDEVPESTLLREYLLEKEEGLEAEDIDALIESDYTFDEEFDDPKEIAQKKRSKKKVLTEAKKFFKEKQEQYKVPLESKATEVPSVDLEEFNAYKERLEAAKSEQEVIQQQSLHFEKKTEELFSPEFKGFKFKVNDKDVVVPFGDPNELKELHSTPRNFINKYLDQETGMLKDAEGYHRALAAAMNPEKLAAFFYELGKAEGVESFDKNIKNVNMSQRTFPQQTSKGGVKFREVPSKD